MAVIGDIFLILGGLFLFLGALGVFRMPDVYNRIQTGTKAATLGALGLIAGVFFHHPEWWLKLWLIGVFVLVTSPVGSSTIARAALSAGFTPWRDDTAQQEGESE